MGKARNLSWDSGKDMLRIASLSTNLKHQSISIVGRTFKIQIRKISEEKTTQDGYKAQIISGHVFYWIGMNQW